ncbi:MAG: hypothetical protein ACNA7Y_05110 [Gammaproteobacteria bacterium]
MPNLSGKTTTLAFYIYITLIVFYFLFRLTPAIFPDSQITPPYDTKQSFNNTLYSLVFVNTKFEVSPPSQEILGGILAKIQAQSVKEFFSFFGVLLFSALICIRACTVNPTQPAYRVFYLTFISLLSILVSLRVGQGWDELFVNLKHSFNLIHHNVFSVNVAEKTEGTVDFFPFLTIAFVHLLFKINLVSSAIIVSLMGNVLTIFVTYLYAKKLTNNAPLPTYLSPLLIALFPPIVFTGATGFMAGLFSGLVLLCAYWFFVLRGKWVWKAYVLLGLLTLFRTEAVLLAVLIWSGVTFIYFIKIFQKKFRKHLTIKIIKILAIRLAVVLLPFILTCLARFYYFDHLIPTPIVFKNTAGNFAYLKMGIEFYFEIISSLKLDKIFLVTGIPLISFLIKARLQTTIFFISVMLFCASYMIGGGDWFPTHWARYLAPMLVLLIASVLPTTYIFIQGRAFINPMLILLTIGILVSYKLPSFVNHIGNSWSRIDSLGTFGRFLDQTTEKKDVIASPEVATIMYFANRDLLDLLGVANRDIANSPLNPLSLPGDLLHRKRNFETIQNSLPTIIALYEMAFLVGPNSDSSTSEKIGAFVQTQFLGQGMLDIAYYRAGSFDSLITLGYTPLSIRMANYLFFYWVHKSSLSYHIAQLRALGFSQLDSIKLHYKYSEHITSRFKG